MSKYTDEDIRKKSKITCQIAGDYLGISANAVSIGIRNNLLPIGFAVHNEENDRAFSESWSYYIVAERLIAYRTRELELYEYAFSLGKYKNKEKQYEGKEDVYG